MQFTGLPTSPNRYLTRNLHAIYRIVPYPPVLVPSLNPPRTLPEPSPNPLRPLPDPSPTHPRPLPDPSPNPPRPLPDRQQPHSHTLTTRQHLYHTQKDTHTHNAPTFVPHTKGWRALRARQQQYRWGARFARAHWYCGVSLSVWFGCWRSFCMARVWASLAWLRKSIDSLLNAQESEI